MEEYKKVGQVILGTTPTLIYQVPINKQCIIKHMRMVNPSGGSATAKLWHGGTENVNVIIPTVTLAANEWYEFDGSMFGSSLESFYGQSNTASAITVTMYGVEVN